MIFPITMGKLATNSVSHGVRIDKGNIRKYIALDKNSEARTLAVTLDIYKAFVSLFVLLASSTTSGDMVTVYKFGLTNRILKAALTRGSLGSLYMNLSDFLFSATNFQMTSVPN